MPLGSESALGLAGPNGTPLIAELPAPADPAGGVSCARAGAGTIRPPSAKPSTSTELPNIEVSPGRTVDHDVSGSEGGCQQRAHATLARALSSSAASTSRSMSCGSSGLGSPWDPSLP